MQNASKLFGWVADSATSINASLADGLQLTDVLILVSVVQTKPDFKTVFSEAVSEISSASEDDITTLKKEFNAKLVLTSAKAEKIAEHAFAILLEIVRLGYTIKN